MLVTQDNFDDCIQALKKSPKRAGLDTETFGLWWWQSRHVPWYKPGVFAVQFSLPDGQDFYLDFHHSEKKLGATHFERLQREIFSDPSWYWFIQNAKFDLHQLRNHGIYIEGTVHCTKHIARVVNNLEPQLHLSELAHKYLGSEKLDVITHINENKLFTEVKKYGRGGGTENWLHFDKLPLDLSVRYGERDTQLCLALGEYQLKQIAEIDATLHAQTGKKLRDVLENENKLTKTVFEMERVGVKIDREYCEKAYNHECDAYTAIKEELDKETVEPIDWLSPQQIKKFFEARGSKSFKLTEKGAMSFDKEALESIADPAAALILKYRYHYKRAHTYFENFIWLADEDDVIHCDLQNSGADTGRMSCWNPNLQNVPKRRDKDEADFKVRRCFIPRTEEGFFFGDFDGQAAEYRLMLDYAKETKLIEMVMAGHDVHDATRDELGLATRDEAKTMNFGLLYGMGVKKLANDLKCREFDAKKKKAHYFSKLPGVQSFIGNVHSAARSRGYVFNWLGRILRYQSTGGFGVETWFKSPNGVIQSGVGDWLKVAANRLVPLFQDRRSRMLLPVHDAILIELHKNEIELIPQIKKIMVESYPHKILPMDVDAGFSASSWGELVEELPTLP